MILSQLDVYRVQMTGGNGSSIKYRLNMHVLHLKKQLNKKIARQCLSLFILIQT